VRIGLQVSQCRCQLTGMRVFLWDRNRRGMPLYNRTGLKRGRGAVTDSDQKTLWMTPGNPADSCGHIAAIPNHGGDHCASIMSCATTAPVGPSLPAAILYAASRTSPPLPYQHTDIPTSSQCRCSPTKSPLAVLSWAVALYLGDKRRGGKTKPSSGRCLMLHRRACSSRLGFLHGGQPPVSAKHE
jgi:hypothetical protein